MFERPRTGERALIVHMEMRDENVREELEEFRMLAESAGAEVVGAVTGTRRLADPRFFIGGGKVEEIKAAVQELEVDVVLFNHALRPSQERNLERAIERRVLDRTGLILDIFAQRARSHEGKLQVELAQLQHLSTRLVRGWTHLERQKGGIGLRGPGETQLETDRRLLGERLKQLQKRLEKVRQRRQQGRQSRRKNEVPTVSLVGYTNAGKSTLFNALTGATVYAANQLFATLDPTLRRLDLGHGTEAVIADTVGFIRHLPHDLVDAFHSTLQETAEADLLLHVIDAADPERREHIEQVQAVLAEIEATDVPQIRVMNKIDALPGDDPTRHVHVERNEAGQVRTIWLSAQHGEGLDRLLDAIREYVAGGLVSGWLTLGADQGRVRARLFEMHAVVEERIGEQGEIALHLELPRERFERLRGEGAMPGEWRPDAALPPLPDAVTIV